MKHLIKLALVLLAGVAAYLVYGFTAAVAPSWVAALAAGSLVSTYIGLAFADIPATQQINAVRVAIAAMVVEALYGTLFVLSQQYPAFFALPPVWAAVPLAMLHGASFSVLAFFVSLFVFHAQRGAGVVSSPEERVALILADALAARLPALPEQASYPAPRQVHDAGTQAVHTPNKAARIYACPSCGQSLSQGQYGAAVRHGHCRDCPPALQSGQDAD